VRCCLLPLAVLAACFSPSPSTGLPCSTTGACPSGQVCTGQGTCELPDFPDAAPDACTTCPSMISWFPFDGDLSDVVGEHGANPSGTTPAQFVPGNAGEGQAVHFPAAGTSWVEVADSSAFDLSSGRVELWFRYGAQAPAGDLGLISRDANGTTTDGHFNIRLGFDRNLVVRIQQESSPSIAAYRCTDAPIAPNTWTHVEVDFGPAGLVLRVGGVTATATTWLDDSGATVGCDDPWTRGIAGNDNPWVFGGLNWGATPGTNDDVTEVAGDVDLDDVIIWSVPAT